MQKLLIANNSLIEVGVDFVGERIYDKLNQVSSTEFHN